MVNQLSLLQKVIAVIVIGVCALLSLPNVLTAAQRAHLPSWVPSQPMTLGLDLQGGAHLVLGVDMSDIKTRTLDNMMDDIRITSREQHIYYTNLHTANDGVELTLRDATQADVFRKAFGGIDRTVDVGADGETRVAMTDTAWQNLQSQAMQKTVQVLRGRVDEFGVAEPVIQQEGKERVIVELPGVKDVNRAKASIGRTAQLTFHLVDDSANASGFIPADKMKLEEPVLASGPNGQSVTSGSRPIVMEKRPALTGEMLTHAGAGFDQNGTPSVDIAFDARGTREFAKISTDNVGKRFAIVLDGKVYSAPVFREPILSGRAQITGSFSTQEAQDLSAILNAGALPTKVNVVEERTVGPTLGEDSIQAGQKALIIGLVGVLIFMGIFYGLFGLFANVALVVNLVILVGIMSFFGFTLTLPGMAAIVLTLGMAVDANVLIFERMREEVALGKKPLSAMMSGFGGAFATILDSHVTTLVAAIVLFCMGTGPVKGFAVSLGIGIAASLFTSITLTRWLCMAWLLRTKAKSLPV